MPSAEFPLSYTLVHISLSVCVHPTLMTRARNYRAGHGIPCPLRWPQGLTVKPQTLGSARATAVPMRPQGFSINPVPPEQAASFLHEIEVDVTATPKRA